MQLYIFLYYMKVYIVMKYFDLIYQVKSMGHQLELLISLLSALR